MLKKLKIVWAYLVKFWKFLWYDDSALSYVLNFFVAFIFIKFIFFPGLGFVLNNDYPIVAIVSGSMEHKVVGGEICDVKLLGVDKASVSFDQWWQYCGDYYGRYNLGKDDFLNFDYNHGLNIGDVMILYGKSPSDIEIGEVLVFVPQDEKFFRERGPVIHRVVDKWTDEYGEVHFRTKGDHNPISIENFENDITEDKVIGVGMIRVPYIGYAKILLSNAIFAIVGIVT